MRWISSSVGGSSSGRAEPALRTRTASHPARPVADDARSPSRRRRQTAPAPARSARGCSSARTECSESEPLAEESLWPRRGMEGLERDDVPRTSLEEHALSPPSNPARAPGVGRRSRTMPPARPARRRRDGRERDDRADRTAVWGVHPDHCDVPVAELVGVPADDRPALEPLPPVDGDLIGDRAAEPEPRRAQAAGSLTAADTTRSPTASP